ncbi:sodium:proton antiporter [bacterium]|nr:sodium:proton antiporter [bacterium]
MPARQLVSRSPLVRLACLLLLGVALAAPAFASAGHPEAAAPAAAAGHQPPALGETLPLWSVLPFVGILLSIALFPLLAPHFWHHHFPKVSAAWALILAVPFLIAYRGQALQSLLHIALIDYIPFIILLWALFTIAGGIFVGGALRGTPAVNTLLLLIGTVLASWIGTTGASMVMIRPVLRANAWRRRQVHVVAFFIFLIGNIGGSLTPLGDPPLFLGFLHGVPFFWVTKALLAVTGFVTLVLLAIFYVFDRWHYARETERPAAAPGEAGLRIEGAHNLLFLLGVMGGVIYSGYAKLPHLPIYGHVGVDLQNWVRDGILILMGVLSLATTRKAIRAQNGFTWAPIQEVAYLFAGIFVTIIPALAILQAGEHGALAGLIRAVREPAHYFWATGSLSSFLDNAPTYLTFYNTALGSLGQSESAVPGLLGYAGEAARNEAFIADLMAISAGAVFMGANSYIGNAPNFMIKSIAEEAGVPMPSFFGYMLRYSIPFLIPVFVLVTFIFFR